MEGQLISLRRWFYEFCKQEVRSYLRWRACLVSSSSSGGGRPAVNMKADEDLKRYLVPALGNINHTVFGSFPPVPPQPCGHL